VLAAPQTRKKASNTSARSPHQTQVLFLLNLKIDMRQASDLKTRVKFLHQVKVLHQVQCRDHPQVRPQPVQCHLSTWATVFRAYFIDRRVRSGSASAHII
jgi:hypothetical protein